MKENKKGFPFLAFIIYACLIIFLSVIYAADSQKTEYELISLSEKADLKSLIASFPVDPVMADGRRSFFLVERKYLESIKKAGFDFRLEKVPSSPIPGSGSNLNSTAQGGLNGAYHSYQELASDLRSLATSYPGLAQLHILGKSLENRNIYALKISDNVSLKENEAKVAFLGCHHAREWISVEVPLLIGRNLLENYNGDSRIKNLVDSAEIWIIPLVNPDGLEYSILNYRLWRKNRRFNQDGSYGVDLNRNYSYQWAYDNLGSSPEPRAETYRGTAPFSEPETEAVKNLFLKNSFQAAISYHSYSQIILYPWGFMDQATDQEELLSQLAAQMASLISQVNGRFYEIGRASSSLYLTNGDFADWIYGFFQIPVFTIELPPVDRLHGGFLNSEEDINNIFLENWPAALFLLDWAISSYPASKRHQRILPENKLEKLPGIVVKDKRSLF